MSIRAQANPIGSYRTCDVLKGLLAEVGEIDRDLSANLIVSGRRDADASRLSDPLEPSRDVDTITKNVVALDQDVAEIDADPVQHAVVLGDGVNIASRLEGIAEPGGICISSSTYEQVRGKVSVDFTDLGEQTLKNIARPIRAYAVGLSANADRAIQLSTSAPRLSIVVLPFANNGGDPGKSTSWMA